MATNHKERLVAIIKAAYASSNPEKAISVIERCADNWAQYVAAVVAHETRTTIAFLGQSESSDRELNRQVMERAAAADKSRRIAHECAIDGVNMINRFAAANGVDPIWDGDTSDRWAVADFCLEFVEEIFGSRDAVRTTGIIEKVMTA